MKKLNKKNWYIYLLVGLGVLGLFSAALSDDEVDYSDLSAAAYQNTENDVTAETIITTEVVTAEITVAQSPSDTPTPIITKAPTATPQPTSDTRTVVLKDGATIEVSRDIKYCGSVNSDVYHLISCRHVSSISLSNFVTYSSKEEAISMGKRGCKTCNP